MTEFTELIDLAAERLRAAVVAANDDFFAEKENLIKPAEAVFLPDEYTERGKWMDGWESRRRREPGHDWAIVRLGVAGIVRGVVVDTAHFKGNNPEAASIEAALIGRPASLAELEDPATEWIEILPKSPLRGDFKNTFAIQSPYAFDHVRLHIYPDGGVARLRVHGEPVVRWGRMPTGEGLFDLAAAAHGANVLACSDMFFGERRNLVMPGEPRNMGEGWETRRRRGPGHDWALIRLAARGRVQRIELDTMHFKGNAPARVMIEGTGGEPDAGEWRVLVSERPVLPHARHLYIDEVEDAGELTHVRLNVHPCGGVARLRLWGELSGAERERQGLRALNALPPRVAERELVACCGSTAWARAMNEARPFASVEALRAAADRIWAGLAATDQLEAFAAHPRIGERKAGSDAHARWSRSEQSRAAAASAETLEALAQANLDYEQKYGFVFLICATGKSADEILAAARKRLAHTRDQELRIAAEEQAKITELRLTRLLRS
jgi:allantoicase